MSRHSIFFQASLMLLLLFTSCKEDTPNEPDPIFESSKDVFYKTIDQNRIKAHLTEISSDAYMGRDTGTEGQKMAANYIRDHFQKVGLESPTALENPYFQSFDLNSWNLASGVLEAGNYSADLFDDFVPYGASKPINVEILNKDVVFVRFGIVDPQYSDYESVDVNGKGVMFFLGAPEDLALENGDNAAMSRKIAEAKLHGATFAIAIFYDESGYINYFDHYQSYFEGTKLTFDELSESDDFPVFIGAPGMGNGLFGKSVSTLLNESAGQSEQTISMSVTSETGKVQTENVIGYVEGSDLKDEVVVLTAHYDHVGAFGDVIYNGADDNGSGTSALMEMAETVASAKTSGNGPRRTLVFLALSGEEKGLLGSVYYTENPVFSLDQTVANVNSDMLGRIDDKHSGGGQYVYPIGSDFLSSDLHEIFTGISGSYFKDLTMDFEHNDPTHPKQYYFRSDQYNFAIHNIPVMFFTDGEHEDYHRPTDTADKIDYALLERRTELVFATAWELANVDEKPKVDQQNTGGRIAEEESHDNHISCKGHPSPYSDEVLSLEIVQ
ncbi:M28 family peptidase [Limibacter armeniacum]|uniref:M28 family peptidase n=1 Tax=Limibacter armeniacum TaxID=466084 RepID=UPI002FE5AA85